MKLLLPLAVGYGLVPVARTLLFGNPGPDLAADNIDNSIFPLAGTPLDRLSSNLTVVTQATGCESLCERLASGYSSQVLQRNTSAYTHFANSYWAQQQTDLAPQCVFEPTSVDQVAVVVRLIREKQHECPFAVRSGGHGAFAGASNVQNGVVISLRAFKQIEVAADSDVVSIGPGNTWLDVYKVLDPQGISVVGGRYPTVGVGGLSLGGGLSYFSNTYGWTCDNIRSYEVVTADGDVIEVSKTSHPDLYWALKGGGNNFGIVTKITFEAISVPKGLIWGGFRVHLGMQSGSLIQAAYNLGTTGVQSNPGVGQIIVFMRLRRVNLACVVLSHMEPIKNPPAMKEFLSVWALRSTTQVRTIAEMAAEIGVRYTDDKNKAPPRRARESVTFLLSLDLMKFAKDVCFEELGKLSNVRGSGKSTCVFQIISTPQFAASERKGGNALGLTSADGPLLLLNVVFLWDDATDDERVHACARAVITRTTKYAKANGWARDFIYMNYAGEFQGVIAGYGEANKARLLDIAKEYDPEGLFQHLQPGYFKLSGRLVDE